MDTEQSRRAFVKFVAASASTAALIAVSANNAQAYQGNMERALEQLHGALRSLRHSTSDKGGHKGRAIGLIMQAIDEVQAGIDYAAQHFGD
jgi:Spy/CpxP family protein refolding chaperone